MTRVHGSIGALIQVMGEALGDPSSLSERVQTAGTFDSVDFERAIMATRFRLAHHSIREGDPSRFGVAL